MNIIGTLESGIYGPVLGLITISTNVRYIV